MTETWEVVTWDRPGTGTRLLRIDGAARPNPGHGGAAVVAEDGTGASVYLGDSCSNNYAEHAALALAVRWLAEHGISGDVEVYTDSTLVAEHWMGREPQSPRLGEILSSVRRTAAERGISLDVRWVGGGRVIPAHERVSAVVADRPPLERRWTPQGRILHRDLFPWLEERGWSGRHQSRGFVETSGPSAHVTAWPFFVRDSYGAAASTDDQTWERAQRAAAYGPVVAVWRPYGPYNTPLVWGQLRPGTAPEVGASDEVVPLLACPLGEVVRGDPSGRRAYSGAVVFGVSAPWRPIGEVLR